MTKTTTESSQGRMRLSMRRAAFVATTAFVLLVAAGCSPSTDEAVDTTVTTVATSQDESTTTTTSTVNPGDGIDVRALLAEALSRYEDGYAFDAVAEIEGSQAATVTGVVIGRKAEMMITSGGATVTYIITPDQSWIQTEGGEWQEDDSADTIERPLDNLASPTSIKIVAADDNGITAVAAYDGAAFDTDGAIDMNLVFVDGLLVRASYTTDVATVTTNFAALGDQVIVVPVPSA